MPYDPALVQPMREELTQMGVEELNTRDDVKGVFENASGTQLLVVNSVCGCAAGAARPAVGLALQHNVKPDKVVTVFAGQDLEATAQAREYILGYQPSSPSMALFKEGKLVLVLERKDIEGRAAPDIAADLTAAFDRHCASSTV